ncbi:MAG TPA: DUF4271 domain-containing protein [Lutibacter sp.]|nr:DUF4271 domain-containing protein [Lutibacter sp.]
MEIINRISANNDWVTLIILGILFLVVLANFTDQKRLRLLFALPYNKFYRLQYSTHTWDFFNGLFFVISILTLSLFIFLSVQKLNPNFIAYNSNPYIKIVGIILGYWIFRYVLGIIVAYLFEIKKTQNQAIFIKMSYYYSASLYLLIFLIFSLYFFDFHVNFIYFTVAFFIVFFLIRYVNFLVFFKRQISSHLFYFILYLCTLEIAPILIAIKIGVL